MGIKPLVIKKTFYINDFSTTSALLDSSVEAAHPKVCTLLGSVAKASLVP